MKPKSFAVLLVAAVLSFAVAVSSYVATRPWSVMTESSGKPMLPQLKLSAADIAGVEIEQGTQSLKLSLDNGKWVLASHEGYPANPEGVRTLLRNAIEADLVERKTAVKDHLPLLGLGDPKASGSGARLVRFTDKAGKPLGEIVVGNTKADAFGAGKGGSYVRLPDAEQSWLASRQIDGSTTLNDWVTTRVIDLSPQSIKTAEMTVGSEPPYKIVRDADGRTLKLDPMPAGKKVKYVNAIDEMVESATFVDFKKVRKAGKADALPKAGTVSFVTESGLKVGLDVRSDGKEAWVRISAAGTGDAAVAAKTIAGRVDGWEFEIPVAKLPGLLKKQSDLLEDAPA